MKDLLSMIGKAILWIAILLLSISGPIMWLIVDIGIWKKVLGFISSIFGGGIINDYTAQLFKVFLLYSTVAGVVVSVCSIISWLLKKKKVTGVFVFLRFIKGFIAVALALVYMFIDRAYGLTSGIKGNTPIASVVNAIFAVIGLAIPIIIIVLVHKATAKLESIVLNDDIPQSSDNETIEPAGISPETKLSFEEDRERYRIAEAKKTEHVARQRKAIIGNVLTVLVVIGALVFGLFHWLDGLNDKAAGYTPTPSTRPITATQKPSPTATYSASIAAYYIKNYPQTWGYISKYAEHPYIYVNKYDAIWGDLQKYHGDGIVFDTLTKYEQSLVNYPSIGSYIYFAVGQSTYHSTKDCYTLLRSEVSLRNAKYAYMYEPCSKCVGE